MRVEFEAPSIIDASEFKAVESDRAATASFRPHVRKGNGLVLCGYLRAVGTKGATAVSRVMFNQRTGSFGIQDLTTEPGECLFDEPVDAVIARRATAHGRGRKRGKRTDAATPVATTGPTDQLDAGFLVGAAALDAAAIESSRRTYELRR